MVGRIEEEIEKEKKMEDEDEWWIEFKVGIREKREGKIILYEMIF